MRLTTRLTGLILLAGLLAGCAATKPARKYSYPAAREDRTIDDYHGTKVADPYRWLEDPDSKETLEWVEAQNKITYAFIRTPKWEKIKTRLTKLWNYPKWSLPEKVAGRYFYTKNDGLQNQAVLYVQDRLDSQPFAHGLY